jgi:prepilin-type processing-associated H-X9-DG protein
VILNKKSVRGFIMRKIKGLTRIDLTVALTCVALVLGEAGVINAGGRERSKKEICFANLRSLAAAWQIYSNDNKGKVPVGDVYYSWNFPDSAGGPQPAWFEWPDKRGIIPPEFPTKADWEHYIALGTLWKYVGDYNIYRCPSDTKNYYVTYSMSHSMNTTPSSVPAGSPMVINITQIQKPAERYVFLDVGYAKYGAFYIHYGSASGDSRWYDKPPMVHDQGTTFVFADGHTEYRQWTDPHALASVNFQWGTGPDDNCDCDLRWMTKITWGDVPYTCTDPNKNCEY